jgi:hypothetical protein
MQVEIGNASAIEGYRDTPDGELKFRLLGGERTTTIMLTDDLNISEAAQTVIATLGAHMEPGSVPAWIESDNVVLHGYLCAHYEIEPSVTRPPTWGALDNAPRKVATKKKSIAKVAVQEAETEPQEGEI